MLTAYGVQLARARTYFQVSLVQPLKTCETNGLCYSLVTEQLFRLRIIVMGSDEIITATVGSLVYTTTE